MPTRAVEAFIPPSWEGFDSWTFRVCFHTRAQWTSLPTSRESSRAGGALAETEPFSSLQQHELALFSSACSPPFPAQCRCQDQTNTASVAGPGSKNKVSLGWPERSGLWFLCRAGPSPSFPACVPCKRSRLWTGWENIWAEVALSPGTQEAQRIRHYQDTSKQHGENSSFHFLLNCSTKILSGKRRWQQQTITSSKTGGEEQRWACGHELHWFHVFKYRV